MKKIMVLFLIVVFSLSLIACGDNKDPKGNNDNNNENGAGLGEVIFD